MNVKGIGIDSIEIDRFRSFKKKKKALFVLKTFSHREREYCFSYRDPSSHLAGTFAAKEAASKALGTNLFPFTDLEIRRTKQGKPEVWKGGRKLAVLISITHNGTYAVAIAVR